MKELNDYTGNGTWNFNNLNNFKMKNVKAIATKIGGWLVAAVAASLFVFVGVKAIKLVYFTLVFIWNI